MRLLIKLYAGLLLGFGLVGICLAMEPVPFQKPITLPHTVNTAEEIYKTTAQKVLSPLLSPHKKNLTHLFAHLSHQIVEEFSTTWKQTHLDHSTHIQKFIQALLVEALERYQEHRSKFSKTKETLWQTPYKLLTIGVLKHVATKLNVTIPLKIESSINKALSYLHFYSSPYDFSGTKAFNVKSGVFLELNSQFYPEYGLCIDSADTIIYSIYEILRQVLMITQEIKDWDKYDRFFQKEMIVLGKLYKLEAYMPKSRSWVEAQDIIERCSRTGEVIAAPETYRKSLPHYNIISPHDPLPKGTYAGPIVCSYWMQPGQRLGEKASRGQGLKIHVSAKPETALEIAKIALPILQASNINYKVMYDLRYMRQLYYLTHYEDDTFIVGSNKSSQAGKFIAIYPSSPSQAISITMKLDQALRDHNLQPHDFVRLAGDAQIGKTGGIFARYGKIGPVSHKGRPEENITPVDPGDESISFERMHRIINDYNPNLGLADERYYPWPDYMNNRELFNTPLFGQLEVTWVNPYHPDQVITWENRPNCWAELKGEKCKETIRNENKSSIEK